MASVNLEQMSYLALKDLADRVEKATIKARAREAVEVKNKVALIAEQHGMTLSELFDTHRRRMSASRNPAKYVNPRDPKQTWSGRGRRPHWFVPDATKGKPTQTAA